MGRNDRRLDAQVGLVSGKIAKRVLSWNCVYRRCFRPFTYLVTLAELVSSLVFSFATEPFLHDGSTDLWAYNASAPALADSSTYYLGVSTKIPSGDALPILVADEQSTCFATSSVLYIADAVTVPQLLYDSVVSLGATLQLHKSEPTRNSSGAEWSKFVTAAPTVTAHHV